MSAPTFVPPRAPKAGSSNKPEFKVLKADFGDGYTQTTRQMNNVRRVYSIGWELLSPTQAQTIIDFIQARGGADPFWYTPSDELTPILWTCEDFTDVRGEGGLRNVDLVLKQSFNIV